MPSSSCQLLQSQVWYIARSQCKCLVHTCTFCLAKGPDSINQLLCFQSKHYSYWYLGVVNKLSNQFWSKWRASQVFSPTAIGLGFSATVKVRGRIASGLSMAGSLQQIRLGPPEGSAEGSTKVPARVHQSSGLGLPKGSGKVPARAHQGSTRVRKSCDLCSLLGQIRFGAPKVSVEGSPITSLNWSSRFLSSILDFWGKMARLSSWALCSKWLSPPKRFFLGCSPNSSARWSHSLLRSFRKWLLLQKRFCGGCRQP